MMDFDLNQVFEILDENGEGLIQLRRFIDIATNYYSDAEQLARITKALDPENTGFINYDQFCSGIAQISSLQGLTLNEVASDLTRRSRENSLVEDSDRRSLNQDGSTTTFNEYDVENDEVFPNQTSKVQFRQTNGRNSVKKTNGKEKEEEISNSNSKTPIVFNSTFYADGEEEFTAVAEPSSTPYTPETVYSRPVSQRISQIFKRTSYIQPTISTDPNDQQLQETVDELQKTVETLTEQKLKTSDRLAKIQSENSDLRSRLLALEDRFHDLEGQHARASQSEKKYVEYITQKDRSFVQEKEILQTSVMRINVIESELKETQTNNVLMKKDVKELKQKLDDVDTQLYDSQTQCHQLAQSNGQLLEQLRQQREELVAERLKNDELRERLKNESSLEKFGRSHSRAENILKSSATEIKDLEEQIRILELERKELKRENNELRERASALNFPSGPSFGNDTANQSFAAEMEELSKDQLMSKLRDQYVINDRLREYIERMLTVIIEHNPQLLEVTTSTGLSIGSMMISPSSQTSKTKHSSDN